MFKEIIKFAFQMGLIALWILFGTTITVWLAIYFRNIVFIFVPIGITVAVALYTEEKRKQATKKQATEKIAAAPTHTEFKPYLNALDEYEELIKKENDQQKEETS